MKKIFAALFVSLMASSAMAVTYVQYGQWTPLQYCGGETRLTCADVPNARQRNQCYIQFRESYNCSQIKMYVNFDFQPTIWTYESEMKGRFFVDYSKATGWIDPNSFRVFMNSGRGTDYEQVIYRFNY